MSDSLYILTRFNVEQQCVDTSSRTFRRMEAYRFDEEWLYHRIALFNAYTYRSVMSQTNKNFEWLGFVHKDSPSWFIESLSSLPEIKIILCGLDTEAVPRDGVTVNLDSDDMLSRDFVESLKANLPESGAFCFSRGMKYKVATDSFCYSNSGTNPFVCVAGPQTVFDKPHGHWVELEVEGDGRPKWLQVIHGNNIDSKFSKPRKNKNQPLEVARRYFEL